MFKFRKNNDSSFSEIEKIREDISKIDFDIIELIIKRYVLVKSVGECKSRENIGVFSPERENEVLKNLISANKGRISEVALISIFKEIMSGGRAVESNIKVISRKWKSNLLTLAIRNKFGSSAKISFKDSYEDVFNSISDNPLNSYGVIPLEVNDEKNSHKAISSLARSELKICSDIILQKNSSKKPLRFGIVFGHPVETKSKNITTLLYLKLKEDQLLNSLVDILNNGSKLDTKLICLSKKELSFLLEVASVESNKHFTSLNEKLISICSERKVIGFYSKE